MGHEEFKKENGRVKTMHQKAARQSFSLVIVLACVAIFGWACDPGIEYSPKDWPKVEERRFQKTVGSIDITIAPVGGLIANKHLIPEITINNRGDLPVVIERAVLQANRAEYVARPFGENTWVTIQPREVRRITVEWELGKPLYEVLKDPVEMDLTIKVGDRSEEVRIPMVKTFG
jgi:hypothetical protein